MLRMCSMFNYHLLTRNEELDSCRQAGSLNGGVIASRIFPESREQECKGSYASLRSTNTAAAVFTV